VRVIVIGAGEVGSSIAASLCDAHEVVVIEQDAERADSLTYELDVLTITGDGTSLSTLEEAGVGSADMVIASTDSDEANIVACSTAKTLDDPFTIARVKQVDYLETWERSSGAFGVDFMVSTDLLTAQNIVRIAGLPGAQDVDAFADGQVSMAQFEVDPDSPIADQSVREADRFASLTFAALLRDDDVVIPGGNTVIQPGDDVVVIGSVDSVRKFARTLAPERDPEAAHDAVVVGGGPIGFQTARLFADGDVRTRLVEYDHERARGIAEDLPDVVVLESDATDTDFLEREHVGDADLVVAALESDERNLLVSLLAKRLGAKRTVAVVETNDYVDVFETVGVDVAVNPREVTAEEITRFTREQQTANVALIETDRAEVVEIEIEAESVLCDRSIQDATAELPDGVVVGAITRDGDLVTPRGNTVVRAGDHVVLFVDAEILEEVLDEL
jgi:trk system potassium uptake protein TrkA